jgi:hypothetical protein
MADGRRKVAAGDLYTNGSKPGRLVVEYAPALEDALAATEKAGHFPLLERLLAAAEAARANGRAADADDACADMFTNGPFTIEADGRIGIRRGRPRRGQKTLRDYGLTKQRVYEMRLAAQISHAEFERWLDETDHPTLRRALRHFGIVQDPPTRPCPTCGRPLPQRIIRRVLERLAAEHPEWLEEDDDV